jgi:hypothetical protein
VPILVDDVAVYDDNMKYKIEVSEGTRFKNMSVPRTGNHFANHPLSPSFKGGIYTFSTGPHSRADTVATTVFLAEQNLS